MLQCVFVPGKPTYDSPALAWHNRAFEFWLAFWRDTLSQQNAGDPNVDDFLRQDQLTLICYEQKVVALHAYTFFDMRQTATKQHSYFRKSYSDRAISELSKRGLDRLMTMEYLSVAKEWRRKQAGAPLAAVLALLGLKVFEDSGADAIVGVARTDVGVAKMAYECGAFALDRNLVVHNTPCDLIAIRKGDQQPFENIAARSLAGELWNHKLSWCPTHARNNLG